MSSHNDAAQAIIANSLTKGSKDGYKSKIKHIVQYFQKSDLFQHHVGIDGQLLIPLPIFAVESLFGHLATDTSLPSKSKSKKRCRTAVNNVIENQSSVPTSNRILQRNDDSDDDDGLVRSPAVVDLTAAEEVTISHSTMGGYKSALKKYYDDRNVAFIDPNTSTETRSLDKFCDDFLHSYERTIADKKERGIMDINEGKSAIPVEGFRRLNLEFIKFRPPNTIRNTMRKGQPTVATVRTNVAWATGIFCFANSALQWNLLCRSETLDRLHLPHFDWVNDSLKITVVRHKKDLGGTDKDKNYVYAASEHHSI
jgi:hypothetical protein